MAACESETLIPVDEEIEGDRDSTDDFVFVRVGASVPLKPSGSAFDLQSPPSQPIAISQLHRLLFLAHSQGFFVAKTDDVIEKANEIKEKAKEIKEKGEGPSVEEVSIVDVKIGTVSILSVSKDESTLAAAVGQRIFFFSVLSLLNKEQEPSFSCSLDEAGTVKDFRWQKNMEKSFVVLSSRNTLYHGNSKAELKNVMDKVDAVDWSIDGGFVAVAREHNMMVLSSNFKEIFSMSLSFETWPLTDSEYTVKVDSIKWLRDDSIIIGCFQVNEVGDEEGYLVQVIKSKGHNFSDVSCNPVVYSFPDIFDGVWDILPIGHGPYLLTNYLDDWKVVLASNQKAIDQHILLLKWSLEDNRRELVSLEFRSDKYTPKIEVPENGDDNLVLGFCVEKFSSNEKIKLRVDEKFKELEPRCTLLCLTSEGKLNMFHAARISERSDLPQTSVFLDDNDIVKEKHFTLSSSKDSTTKPRLKDDVEIATADNRLKQMSTEALNPYKDTFQLQKETISPQRKQIGDGSQVGHFTGQIGDSKSSMEVPVVQGSGFAIRNDVTPGAKLLADSSTKKIEGTTTSSIGKIPSEAPAAMHATTKDVVEHGDVGTRVFGSTSIGAAPFGSQYTGKLFGADIRPSTFTFSRSVVSDAHEKTKLNSTSSEFQSSRQLLSSKDSDRGLQSSVFSSSKADQNKGFPSSSLSTGIVELQPTVRGSQLLAQEGSLPGKSHYYRAQPLLENMRASKFHQKLDSEPEISKQFYNTTSAFCFVKAGNEKTLYDITEPLMREVKDMAQELDSLLSFIEKEGGFRDACTVFQRSSLLALENVLGDLSDISHKYRKEIEEQLLEIQQLQNKMLQVSARQGYMKGIVEQASNKKYWDIWNQQKLNPELEAKRQNILNANQNLTNQIIELERHFNTVEINKFSESGRNSLGHTASRSGLMPARQRQSLQSVYNTLNSQLAAAEHLSECLSKQMSELNLNSASVKHQGITKELLESIGLSDEITSFQSPICKRPSLCPDSIRRTPTSTTNAIKQHPGKNTSTVAKGFEPETARRRRDSLDRNWAAFDPPKTTVKRSMQVQHSRVTADKPFLKAKEKFDSQIEAFAIQQKSNASHGSSSSGYLLNEGISHRASRPAFEAHSNLGSKWAKDISGSPHILGSKSHAVVAMERTSTVPPFMSPLSRISSSQSSTKELFGSPDLSSIEATQLGYLPKPLATKAVTSSRNTSSIFHSSISPIDTRPAVVAKDQASKTLNLTSGGTALTLSMPGSTEHLADTSRSVFAVTKESNISSPFMVPAFASAGLNGETTEFNSMTTRNQSSESTSNLVSHSLVSVPTSSSSPLPFFSSKIPATLSVSPPLTPASLTPLSFGKSSLSSKPTGVTNETDSVSTSVSMTDNQSIPTSSLVTTQSQNSVIQIDTTLTTNTLPAKPSLMSSFDVKSGVSNQLASVSSLTSGTSSILFSPSQKTSSTVFTSLSTESRSSTVTEPTLPVTSATVGSVHLDKVNSKSQPTQLTASGEVVTGPKNENNLLRTSSDSTPVAASLSQPEIPSSAAVLSTSTEKDEKLDISLSQEDKMEEEASDTTALSLGSLGGFGLGSTPSSSASKPNPFGGSFLTANSSTPSPPLTLTAPAGEPFRPASFSLPSAQPVLTSQTASSGGFSSGLGGGFTGFGRPAPVGVGQQALGSVLGSFGQSRQLGSGMPAVVFPSSSGFSGAGFSPAANTGGFATAGGFAGAATGGGFTSVAPAGGGFAAAGGGFAAAAKGGGFAALASGGGFAGAAAGEGSGALPPGSGFASTATAGGGFGGAGTGAGFASGGFAAFGSNQGGGFSGFGGNTATGAGKPPAALLTQMRK